MSQLSAVDTVISRMIEDLAVSGGIGGTDVANVTDVSKATVSRWEAGSAKPQPHNELRISDLHYVVCRLAEFYEPADVRTWLYAPHPQLDGERAIDLIHSDRTSEILQIIARLDTASYL